MTTRQQVRALMVKQLHQLEDGRLDGTLRGRSVDALIEKLGAALVRHDREDQGHGHTN